MGMTMICWNVSVFIEGNQLKPINCVIVFHGLFPPSSVQWFTLNDTTFTHWIMMISLTGVPLLLLLASTLHAQSGFEHQSSLDSSSSRSSYPGGPGQGLGALAQGSQALAQGAPSKDRKTRQVASSRDKQNVTTLVGYRIIDLMFCCFDGSCFKWIGPCMHG